MLRKGLFAFFLLVSVASARVVVNIAPPIPVVETVAPAPGPGYVWIPGYHLWDGHAYVWVPGTWVLPPRPHARWEPPHWKRTHGGWFFVEGHWR